MNTNEIPTPRSDRCAVRCHEVKHDTFYVPRIRSREIERSLILATAKLEKAREALTNYVKSCSLCGGHGDYAAWDHANPPECEQVQCQDCHEALAALKD